MANKAATKNARILELNMDMNDPLNLKNALQ